MRIIQIALFSLLFFSAGCAAMKKGDKTKKEQMPAALSGTWVLDFIPTPSGTLDSLYPTRKPELTFEPAKKRFHGYSGCNGMNGPLVGEGHNISFRDDIVMTMMACPGNGEGVFMETLKKINRFDISADGKTLTMIQGDIALLRFHKK